ncbi:MAG: hypothetical protein ACKVU4_13185 [Phycisphaerales bacterium]
MNRSLSRTSIRSLVLLAGVALLTPVTGLAGALAFDGPDDRLPITGITLYRSGVGTFERRGLVEGDQRVQLRFKTEQINDILKSMVLLDLDGGRIDAVSYGSKEPLERRLASFGVDISDDPSAGKLLGRLRGTPVKLVTGEGDVSGTIMNVESRPTIIGGGADSQPAKHDLPWMNLVTASGVKSVNLTTVTGFQILDPVLAEELSKALAALAEHRADRVKTVDVAFRGPGARQIVVAYVHEMPVWKTSYRLILPDAPETKKEDKKPSEGGLPTLQGWAIVENTTDEDWQNVRLSLVSGRPVSFQMDLYEPLHVYRPEVPVPTVPGVAPKVYRGGFDETAVVDRQEALKRPGAPAPSALAMEGDAGGAVAKSVAPGRVAGQGWSRRGAEQNSLGLSADDLSRYSASAQAQAGEIGEVFQYQLKEPVTVERQRSAMLPILSSPIDGRRVSIYNRGEYADHPMRGVELKNSTGLQLMPGPISVFDGSAYAGDAQVGHVSLGDKRLLAYSVDLDVAALTEDGFTATIQKVRIINGLIEQTTKQVTSTAYGFTNKDAKRGRTMLVEHEKASGWDLVDPAKPLEQTGDLYRFELPLKAGESGKLVVRQERVERQGLQVVGYDLGTLLTYVKDGRASQKVVDAVREAGRLQGVANEIERRIGAMEQEQQGIAQDQNRIRENMRTIDRNTDLYKRYATKLNEQEDRLEKLNGDLVAARAELVKAREALAAYLRGLNVE